MVCPLRISGSHDTKPTDPETFFDEDDLKRAEQHELSTAQLKWYIDKRTDMMDGPSDDDGYKLFLQEYPTTFDEAFKHAGGKFFSKVERTELPTLRKTQKYEERWKNPVEGHEYVIGADMGGGVDRDYTVVEIIDITDKEQVCEWRSKLTAPEEVGKIAAAYGAEYNGAMIVPESNNHGGILITYLKANYPVSRIYRQEKIRSKDRKKSMEYGWFSAASGSASKFHLCDHGRAVLNRGLKFYSRALEQELLSFEEKESEGDSKVKKLAAPTGEHDDCVIAFMLGLYAVPRIFAQPQKSAKLEIDSPSYMSFKFARELAIKPHRYKAGQLIGNGFMISGRV